jgi:hypothetical protein
MVGIPFVCLQIGLVAIAAFLAGAIVLRIFGKRREAAISLLASAAALGCLIAYWLIEHSDGIERISAIYWGVGAAIAIGLAFGWSMSRLR